MKITMTGGSPWGFKMTGGKDFRQPLAIGKVTPGSKADRAGVKEGHRILSVNSEDVSEFSHLAAQNKIKSTGQTLTMQLSNTPNSKIQTQSVVSSNPVYNPQAPSHMKSASTPAAVKMSKSSPTPYQPHAKSNSYDDRKTSSSSQPDIEYHKVDHRDSHRRIYDESAESEWKPSVNTDSHAQSPTFAMLQRTGNAPHQSVLSAGVEKPTIQYNTEISDLIREQEEENKRSVVDGSMHVGEVKQWDPAPSSNSRPSGYQSVPPPQSTPSYASQTYGPPPTNNSGGKQTAIGNISKFLSNSGAKQGRPHFVKALQDLEATVGDPAVLEVRVGNTLPAPTVHWYHNGRPCSESKERDIRFLNKGSVHTMVIGEFTTDFLGNYRCELLNKHGSESCRCNITAKNITIGSRTMPTAQASSYNSSPSSYQPNSYQPNNSAAPYKSTYSPNNTASQPKPLLSNATGLYSSRNQQQAYDSQTRKSNSSRGSSISSNTEEESDVLRALREQDNVRKPIQTRSMKMLEASIQAEGNGMPESDDL